ncbi:MAG: TauD/TfdA family dioxygenase [Actinomycetota bacterium]
MSQSDEHTVDRLRAAFGEQVRLEPLGDPKQMGRRIHGVALNQPLNPDQASAVIGALDAWRVVSFPDQIEHGMTVVDLERLANHFGAPIPHPSNIDDYLNAAAARLKEPSARPSTQVDAAFPDTVTCLPGGDSAAVYLVTNLIGSGPDATPAVSGGQHWHTDIEFEPVPLSTSMFLVHHVPTTRREFGSWVTNPPREPGFYHPESPALLAERREALPLNGETAYADTAAAYDGLGAAERTELDGVMIRRRLRKGDEGFLMPLVHVNPRTGRKSLHSPIWASRGKRVAPAQVEGLDGDESRHFLDRLEQHCLAPEFRYDHVHRAGDVTIWDNFATLHVAPPTKSPVNDPADARLMYRISCKGPTSASLPRPDPDEWIANNVKPAYRSPVFNA